MQDLIISINNNILRVSTIDKEAVLKNAMVDIPKEIVDDSKILDTKGLASIIEGLISTLTPLKKNKLRLDFIMEPQDVFLRFVTVSKGENNIDEQIISEIKTKEPDLPLDNLYFSYKKLVPFVYQFVGVEKSVLNSFLEVSNVLDISLRGIIPWVLALPKYEGINDPAVFVAEVDGDQVIALSELNGIFFSGVYENKSKKTSEELSALVKDLSFYKKSSPIKCVFTFNCDSFEIPGYEVKPITSPNFSDGSQAPAGMEINTIINFLIDSDPLILESQLNLLNLLPLPVEVKKSPALVVVGSVVGVLLLVVGAYFGIRNFKGEKSVDTQMAQTGQSQENAQVLSQSVENEQSENGSGASESDGKNEGTGSGAETDPNAKVQKGNLKIRLENGAGINGLAARTKVFLEDFGYTVLTIDTANTKTDSTVLQFKKSAAETYKDMITEDMKSKFPDIEVKDDLPDDSDYDLLIILGASSQL